jgi:hypothetical protein
MKIPETFLGSSLDLNIITLYEYVRLEVLTAVKMSMLFFWVVTPCGLVGRYSMFLRNFGIYLQAHTASQSRIVKSTLYEHVGDSMNYC